MENLNTLALYSAGAFDSYLPLADDSGDSKLAESWIDMRETVRSSEKGNSMYRYLIPRVPLNRLDSAKVVAALYKNGFIPLTDSSQSEFYSLAWESIASGSKGVSAFGCILMRADLIEHLHGHISELLFDDGTYVYPKEQSDRYLKYRSTIKKNGLYYAYKKTSDGRAVLSDAFYIYKRKLTPVWSPLKTLVADSIYVDEEAYEEACAKYIAKRDRENERTNGCDTSTLADPYIPEFKFYKNQERALVHVSVEHSDVQPWLEQTLVWRERPLECRTKLKRYMQRAASLVGSDMPTSKNSWESIIDKLKSKRSSYWAEQEEAAKAKVAELEAKPKYCKYLKVKKRVESKIKKHHENTKTFKAMTRCAKRLRDMGVNTDEEFPIDIVKILAMLEEAQIFLTESVNPKTDTLDENVLEEFDEIVCGNIRRGTNTSFTYISDRLEQRLGVVSQQVQRKKHIDRYKRLQVKSRDLYRQLETRYRLHEVRERGIEIRNALGLNEAVQVHERVRAEIAKTWDFEYAEKKNLADMLKAQLKQSPSDSEANSKLHKVLLEMKALKKQMSFKLLPKLFKEGSDALKTHSRTRLPKVVPVAKTNRVLVTYPDLTLKLHPKSKTVQTTLL